MNDLLQRLRERKLVQWALAYVAAAFALIQVLDVVAQRFGWPEQLEKLLILALAVGFFVTLVLAWYHGEKGAQRVTTRELLVLAVVLVIGGGVLWHFDRAGPVAAAGSGDSQHAVVKPRTVAPVLAGSIAVLPFENLSSDKDNAYFVAGMQDLILTKLADIGELKVISRTSTMSYASHPQDLKTVGRELGAATILEGSVQRQGKIVLINVQLIDAANDTHLWGHSYERTLDNVFGVEGEVADRIAQALHARLSPVEAGQLATALSSDAQANDAFLRAEYFSARAYLEDDSAPWKQAIGWYRQAITAAPDFALARARLSQHESTLAWFGGGGEDVARLQADARAQAEQALRLAPDLPEARLAMGYCDYYGKGDYVAALAAFTTVVGLRPNDVGALTAQANVLRRLGRFDEGTAALRQALVRDPRNPVLWTLLGEANMTVMRWPEAEDALRRALVLDPANVEARSDLAGIFLLSRGDLVAALSAIGDSPQLLTQRVSLLTYRREYRKALDLLDAAPDVPDDFSALSGGPKALRQADLYRLLGDAAQARAHYVQALPKARALLADAGNIAIHQALAWNLIADAQRGIGDTSQGLAAVAKSQALVELSDDRLYGPGVRYRNAAVYAKAGRADLAVPLLASALGDRVTTLYINAPVLLWLDPAWDSIREDPGFVALQHAYATSKPAMVPARQEGAPSTVAAAKAHGASDSETIIRGKP